MPLCRPLPQARREGIEKIVLLSWRLGRLGFEGVDRPHRPAHRRRLAVGVDEAEGIEAVVGRVGEARGRGRALDQGDRARRFRMRRQEGCDTYRIGLAGGGVGLQRNKLLVEALGILHGEDGEVIHARAPGLAVGQGEIERHAAHGFGPIRDVRRGADDREAADHRDPARCKDRSAGKTSACAVAAKPANEADPLGMVAAKTWMGVIDLLEGVDQADLVQTAGRKPPRRPGEGRHNAQQDKGNDAEPHQGGWRQQGAQAVAPCWLARPRRITRHCAIVP